MTGLVLCNQLHNYPATVRVLGVVNGVMVICYFASLGLSDSTRRKSWEGVTSRTSHSLKMTRMLALFFPSSNKLT